MKVKGILFDLDNTLYCESDYLKSTLITFCQLVDINIKGHQLKQIDSTFRERNANVLVGLLSLIQADTPVNFEHIFQVYKQHVTQLDCSKGVKILLLSLKQQGFKLGILTNGVVDVQKNKIKALGLSPLVDSICYAREHGPAHEKPDGLAFKRACESLGVACEQTVMIGDNYKCDIQGALSANLKAVYYTGITGKKIQNKRDIDIPLIHELADITRLITYDEP